MRQSPITIHELAGRTAVHFLLADLQTHPELERLKGQARRSDLKIEDYEGKPPDAILGMIYKLSGRDGRDIEDRLITPMAEIIAHEATSDSVESLRPEALLAISARIELLCDDNGLGGAGITSNGVFDTLTAERDQLMMEGKNP
mgnify:CR=1 FL=1